MNPISNGNELVDPAALGGRHSSQEVTVQRTPGERHWSLVGLQGGHGLNWREQGKRGCRLNQSAGGSACGHCRALVMMLNEIPLLWSI